MPYEVRHRKGCPRASDPAARCRCRPSYRVEVQLGGGKRARRTLPSLAEARAWEAEAKVAARRGQLTTGSGRTVEQAGDALVAGMRSGASRNSRGGRYRPSVIRDYEAALRLHVYPSLSQHRLDEVRRADVLDLVARLLAAGLSDATVLNAVKPLRVIFREAIDRGDLEHNPLTRLRLSGGRKRTETITPEQVARAVDALRHQDRAVWATAFYAGLRRGELAALRARDVDAARSVLRVRRAWDQTTNSISEWTKTSAGYRDVPMPAILRDHLLEHLAVTGRSGDDLVFGSTPRQPFSPGALAKRARKDWRAAGVPPLTLHPARHTFGSMMVAAEVGVKDLSVWMGHTTTRMTLDRYVHPMPDAEARGRAALDAYLAGETTEEEVESDA